MEYTIEFCEECEKAIQDKKLALAWRYLCRNCIVSDSWDIYHQDCETSLETLKMLETMGYIVTTDQEIFILAKPRVIYHQENDYLVCNKVDEHYEVEEIVDS